jgi:glucose/arabinose dehydrogenase
MRLNCYKKALSALVLVAIVPLALAQDLRTEVIASGLQNPWALAFLPEGRMLVTERAGRLRVVQANGQIGAPVAGLPDIAAGGQGGLLDVITDADFVRNRTIYFCFSEPASSGGGNSTALARASLSADNSRRKT